MELEAKTVTVDGVKGTWLSPTSTARVTFLLTECVPSYEAIIDAQAKVLGLQSKAVASASVAIDARTSQANEDHARAEDWKKAYSDEHARRLEETSFWRSPVFLYALGVGTGIGLTVLAAWAMKHAE